MPKARAPQSKKKLGGPRVGDGGPRQDKVRAVEELKERLGGSAAVLLTEYRGMTVKELAELRASLRDAGADYRVFKNTLATIAARELGFDDLLQHLQGPTAFTFTSGDPVVAAKRLTEFAKRVPTLVLKGGLLEGKVLAGRDVTALSALESREVLLARTAGIFLAPVQQLANLFAAAFNQVGSLLVQLRDKTPEQGTAAAAAPLPEPEEAPQTPDAATSEEAAATPSPAAEAPAEEAAPEASAAEPASDAPAEVPEAAPAPEAGGPVAETGETNEETTEP